MVEFDRYGRIRNRHYRPQPFTGFASPTRHAYRGGNRWERLNNFVSNIGDWFGENRENMAYNISMVGYYACWIILAIIVVINWVNEGFGTALLTAILGGIGVFYIGAIGMLISVFVLKIIFLVLRLVLYNIYTLLLTVAGVTVLVCIA